MVKYRHNNACIIAAGDRVAGDRVAGDRHFAEFVGGVRSWMRKLIRVNLFKLNQSYL